VFALILGGNGTSRIASGCLSYKIALFLSIFPFRASLMLGPNANSKLHYLLNSVSGGELPSLGKHP